MDAVVNSPFVTDEKFFYIYKTAVEKAAKLGCEIYKKKPFDKGNGKTAVLSLLTLLDINGFILQDYKKGIGELVEIIKNNDVENAVKWIKGHLERNIYIMP